MNDEAGRSGGQNKLAVLEQRALEGLDLVLGQLDRVLDALQRRDRELAKVVIVDDGDVDGHCVNVHQGILLLVAEDVSGFGDLRLVAALLHLIKAVERMSDQCVKVGRLIAAGAGQEPAVAGDMLFQLAQMGESVRVGVVQGRGAFAERNLALAEGVIDRHRDITRRLNREIFLLAAGASHDVEFCDWTTRMVLVGRALERIGDCTLDIGEQAAYVVSGLFRRFPRAQ